jgi:formyl-CoA transferase
VVNHYRCADGRSFFLVLIKEPEEFVKFCSAIERPDLATDPRFAELSARRDNAAVLAGILSNWFGQRPLAAWQKILDDNAITFGSIATSEEAIVDQQMIDNGIFVEFSDQPGRKTINSPIDLKDFPKRQPVAPPTLGEHTTEILQGLGYDEKRIADLQARQVVQSA